MTVSAEVAVILAGGRGTRMRRDDPAAVLDPVQDDAATRGIKCLVPDASGRPLLDHILTGLADAGIEEVVLVIGSRASPILEHLDHNPPSRLQISIAHQAEPLGTADAVLAAQLLVGQRDFLVLNADNLYPVEALVALRGLGQAGLIGFERAGLVEASNIDPQRIAAFALIEESSRGRLKNLVEKPSPAALSAATTDLVSMNLWRFDTAVFDHCSRVTPSERGELELPMAIAAAVQAGAEYRVIRFSGGVMDLSSRADISAVAAELADRAIAT